jgi:hypothetical protein
MKRCKEGSQGPSTLSNRELDKAILALISDDLDNKAIMIVSTFKENSKNLYIALS